MGAIHDFETDFVSVIQRKAVQVGTEYNALRAYFINRLAKMLCA